MSIATGDRFICSDACVYTCVTYSKLRHGLSFEINVCYTCVQQSLLAGWIAPARPAAGAHAEQQEAIATADIASRYSTACASSKFERDRPEY